jgi:hypothetical protein
MADVSSSDHNRTSSLTAKRPKKANAQKQKAPRARGLKSRNRLRRVSDAVL